MQVQVFHPQDDAGRLLPVAGTVSEDEGRCHKTFVGPPRATDRCVLEFRKTGFRARRVALNERVRDPAIRIGPCAEGERWTGCWVVNVVMVPDGS